LGGDTGPLTVARCKSSPASFTILPAAPRNGAARGGGFTFAGRAHDTQPAGRSHTGPPFARPQQNPSLLPLRTAAGAAPPARGLGAGWAGRDEYAAMGKVVLQVKSLATVSRSIHRLPARAM